MSIRDYSVMSDDMEKYIEIKNVLILNRGEIACRIAKTLRKMGIRSIGIYSEIDRLSPHVRIVDEAYFIGDSVISESYMNKSLIIDFIRENNIQAVHPGFGMFSEDYTFAETMKEMGVVFIGPDSESMRLMGNKIISKIEAKKANVSLIEGYIGEINDFAQARKIIEDIGFPVIVKAADGGGGKGMRIINSIEHAEDAIKIAQSEALQSFGSNKVFIEKYLKDPRHIEIQVLADKYGNIVCLGERECSLQRRYQKVIEEAPSTFVDEKMRLAMYEQVTRLVKQVNYFSVGTVEFLVDLDKNFYFAEMNTRIQVEHTVTELITGIDLVEQMIRVARGEKLSMVQEDIVLDGCAIEARIYSEDPERNYSPSQGFVTEYVEPSLQNVRIDSGICKGYEVGIYYDAMISKICSYSNNRKNAVNILSSALDEYAIKGVKTNISFLQSLLNDRFISGDTTTSFIPELFPDGFVNSIENCKNEDSSLIIIVTISMYLTSYLSKMGNHSSSDDLYNIKSHFNNSDWVVFAIDKFVYKIKLLKIVSNNSFIFEYLGVHFEVEDIVYDGIFCKFILGGLKKSIKLFKTEIPTKFLVEKGCFHGIVNVLSNTEYKYLLEIHKNIVIEDSKSVISPTSGMLADICVNVGDSIKVGQQLVIITAMKANNFICSQRDGVVANINFEKLSLINEGDEILNFL